eukprot:gene13715-16169_t
MTDSTKIKSETIDKESWRSDTPLEYIDIYTDFQDTAQLTVRYSPVVIDLAMGQEPLTRPLKCLDVACGSGALTLPLAERVLQVPGSLVTAVDFSKDMINILTKRTEERGLAVDIHEMDGMNLILPSNEYDHTFSVSGLIFFPDRIKGLSEMHRVLKPGGTALIVAWEQTVFASVASRKAFQFAAPDVEYPEELGNLLTFGTPAQFEKAFLQAGFSSAIIHEVPKDYTFNVEDMVEFFSMNPMTVKIGQYIPDRYEAYDQEYRRLMRETNGKVTITANIGVGRK